MSIRKWLGLKRKKAVTYRYDQDGLKSIHNCDFMDDPAFADAYRAGAETGAWGKSRVHWRVHVVLWAAARGRGLQGDFVECGVHKGGTAHAVIRALDFAKQPRKFYLFDTFAGFDEKTLTERERQRALYKNEYESDVYEEVRKRFSVYPNVEIVRGPVPDTLADVEIDRVAYLSIDMNTVVPEIAAAEHFWPKLVSGATVVLDDYGWPGHEEQKAAFDGFAAERGVPLLRLPTGQAVMIKP
ncbi:TylF/MycF/NovP-related O-methyltransferase [Oceanibacterium hippocampi]|uniref:Macrocin O-methyltransferase n=1 Tax=Oceanibacterium hippocampi TaxID=745714 RepID=A0A1Y5TLH8_9PROT|nr:TylF/MycF/NovP-related O-methyltransferase [Oceanibacterium hippocampi]SLN63194.1 Macrocin O-methyltransferase [Oceanibacterium hippocampi]